MPRPPNIIRPSLLHLSLPEDVRTKLDVVLWSGVEGRVPKGAYQRFFLDRLSEYFSWGSIDLTPYGLPQGFVLKAPKDMIPAITTLLERSTSQ